MRFLDPQTGFLDLLAHFLGIVVHFLDFFHGNIDILPLGQGLNYQYIHEKKSRKMDQYTQETCQECQETCHRVHESSLGYNFM